jgi:putative acetyltransferase
LVDALTIREDDLSGDPVRALVALHLAAAHASSPPGAVFALDLAGLRASGVTVWSAWQGEALAGIGALRLVGDGAGEVKSMRTHPDFLRRGVAAALLGHIVAEARARGLVRLSLETGTGPAFAPALALYLSRGFVEGEAFGGYRPGAFSRFLHLRL